jgi:hypothetical protein
MTQSSSWASKPPYQRGGRNVLLTEIARKKPKTPPETHWSWMHVQTEVLGAIKNMVKEEPLTIPSPIAIRRKRESEDLVKQINTLSQTVAAHQQQLAKLIRANITGLPFEQAEEAYVDEGLRWCEVHAEELSKLPDGYIAIDPDKGLVFHAQTQKDFNKWLAEKSNEEREALFATHTSVLR